MLLSCHCFFLNSLLLHVSESSQGFPDQFLSQPWDHFDDTNGNTFEQRYWVNEQEYSGGGGPAFLMIGGEGEGSSSWLTYGQWWVGGLSGEEV